VKDLKIWLQNLATRPLPGGVAAAAVTAAMGVALIAKATRVTLKKRTLDTSVRAELEAMLDQSRPGWTALIRLADIDEQSYRAVLGTRSLAADAPARRQALQAATEVPIHIAEVCWSLLGNLSRLSDVCWPAVQSELQTGTWLLETGMRASLLAADINLQAWGDSAELPLLQARMDAVIQQVGGIEK
jgi:formiminotetrahydrofolate cyclodeaminase